MCVREREYEEGVGDLATMCLCVLNRRGIVNFSLDEVPVWPAGPCSLVEMCEQSTPTNSLLYQCLNPTPSSISRIHLLQRKKKSYEQDVYRDLFYSSHLKCNLKTKAAITNEPNINLQLRKLFILLQNKILYNLPHQ